MFSGVPASLCRGSASTRPHPLGRNLKLMNIRGPGAQKICLEMRQLPQIPVAHDQKWVCRGLRNIETLRRVELPVLLPVSEDQLNSTYDTQIFPRCSISCPPRSAKRVGHSRSQVNRLLEKNHSGALAASSCRLGQVAFKEGSKSTICLMKSPSLTVQTYTGA